MITIQNFAICILKVHCTHASFDYQVSALTVFLLILRYIIRRYGPLVRHWTMRYEAKHAYFKQLAHSMGNFVNLPFSLVQRHQLYRCYLNEDTQTIPGFNFIV